MLIIDIEIDTIIQNFNINSGATQCCIETPETETGTCLSLLKQNSPFHIRVSIRFRSIYRIKGS